MEAIIFNKDIHYTLISDWYKERNLQPIDMDMLSNLGLIIKNKEDKFLASAFLYPIVGANWCFIEGAISNPNTNKEERTEALDMLLVRLHSMAKLMGYKKACIFSENSGIIKLLEKHNYTQSNKKNIANFWGNL